MTEAELLKKVTHQHCQILEVLEKEEVCNVDIHRITDFALKTVHERVHRMAALGLIKSEIRTEGFGRKRFNSITKLGREILERFRKGYKFSKMGKHGPPEWFNRMPNRTPEYTWGMVFEDARVPRMTSRFIPHAVVNPLKGRNNFGE